MTNKIAMTLALGSMLALGCTSPEGDGSDDSGTDKADQIDGRDDPSGLLANAERRLASLISTADVGQSFGVPDEKAPYPDTYWPMGGDDIAPDGDGIAVEWVNKDGTKCFQRNDCADPAPSPLAKYMAMVNPAEREDAIAWEIKNHGTDVAGVLSWFGHCPGWVATTILHLPVTESLSVRFDGSEFVECTRGSDCTKLEIGDINALAAEIHEGARSKFIGARCDTEFEDKDDNDVDLDSLRDEFGRIVRNGSGCKGLNAGAMMILMANRLKNDELPFAIDAQNEFNTEQIWNQPAYRYTVNRFRTISKSQATHLVASGGDSDTSSDLSGDSYIFNSQAKGFAFVDFSLHWVTETAGPNLTPVSGVDSTNITRMVAVIELDRDASDDRAVIIGGEYLDDASVGADRLRVAPFAWIATDSAPEFGGRHNPFVSPSLVKQLLAMTDAISAGNDGRGPETCEHNVCSTSRTLTNTCNSCATQICDVDSFCCNNSWDAICVNEVASVCGQTCN